MKFILTIFIGCIFCYCGVKKDTEVSTTTEGNQSAVILSPAQITNANITTGKLMQKEISSVIRVNGKIDVPPQNLVSISVPLGGYVKSVSLLPGMQVKRGAILAVIEDHQYIQLQQDFLTAKSRISYVENEYKRQKDLNVEQAVSDKVFQQAEAEYKSQLVLISALKQKLELLGINTIRLHAGNISGSISIRSPVNGFVSKVNVNTGLYVSPADVLFELVNPADIHLTLTIFEKDLSSLYVGQKLIAYTNNSPDKKYPATIFSVGKNLSDERNAEVHCHFLRYDPSLVPGTYMNAEVEIKKHLAYVLPTDAIVSYHEKQFVYIAKENNQFEMITVTTGASKDGYTEVVLPVVNNLANADIVIKGAYSILMMMKNKEE